MGSFWLYPVVQNAEYVRTFSYIYKIYSYLFSPISKRSQINHYNFFDPSEKNIFRSLKTCSRGPMLVRHSGKDRIKRLP